MKGEAAAEIRKRQRGKIPSDRPYQLSIRTKKAKPYAGEENNATKKMTSKTLRRRLDRGQKNGRNNYY